MLCFCGGPSASFTLTSNENVPLTEGVPEITPLDASKVRPVGSVPRLMLHVYGRVPPAAERSILYCVPTVPGAIDLVTIVSGCTTGPEELFDPEELDPEELLGADELVEPVDVTVTLTGFDKLPDLRSWTFNCTTIGVARLPLGTAAARVFPFTTDVDSVFPFQRITAWLVKFAPTTVMVVPFVPAGTVCGRT